MAKENTKETIIREALKLFAEKGFAAVSMRDLAEAVGISASTIYHYYESKQVLFQDMIRQANELTAQARDAFFRVLGETEKVEREPFVRAGVLFATAYLRNAKIDPLLRMLESERFHDADAGRPRGHPGNGRGKAGGRIPRDHYAGVFYRGYRAADEGAGGFLLPDFQAGRR